MNFTYLEINKLPVVIVDNFYSNEELALIEQEIKFLHNSENKFKTPDEIGSAYDVIDGVRVYRKKNFGIILDNTYLDRSASNILALNRKVFSEEFTDRLLSYHYFFKYIKISTFDLTKLHYYGDSHCYDAHIDTFVLSSSTWLFNRPKKFTGGSLFFGDVEVECQYNRYVIFPSILEHRVDSVYLSEEDNTIKEKNGRYSINHFISMKQQ